MWSGLSRMGRGGGCLRFRLIKGTGYLFVSAEVFGFEEMGWEKEFGIVKSEALFCSFCRGL